jgi:hypothetical protein
MLVTVDADPVGYAASQVVAVPVVTGTGLATRALGTTMFGDRRVIG